VTFERALYSLKIRSGREKLRREEIESDKWRHAGNPEMIKSEESAPEEARDF